MIHPAGIIRLLCTQAHEDALILYIRSSHRTGRRQYKNRKSRAAVPRRGVRWRPGLPILRLYYRGDRLYTANE